jgi:tRNA pseudouridine38-40 synthase
MLIRLTLEYDGTNFCGWQVQPQESTVQGCVEHALATVLRQPIRLAAAGRTDAGVHALGQVAVFQTKATPDLGSLCRGLNALAGPDVAVVAADVVPDGFDPRRDARSRLYAYHVLNRSAPSPLWRRRAWHVPYPLDAGAMQAAAALLVGEHDFSSFRDADCDAEHPVRRVLRSEVAREGDFIVYRIEATAFLRHMVRTLVGTLVAVGAGDVTVDAFRETLAGRDRTRAGVTAPAHGLCLVAVRYA